MGMVMNDDDWGESYANRMERERHEIQIQNLQDKICNEEIIELRNKHR